MTRATAADKVRKLLAVARGAGHEAETAALRARELLAKFNLTHEEVGTADQIESTVDGRSDAWMVSLSFAVASSRGCRAFIRPDGSIAIRGTRAAHDNAVALYTTLSEDIEHSCAVARPALDGLHIGRMVSGLWGTRFCEGFVDAVAARLVAPPPASTTTDPSFPAVPPSAPKDAIDPTTQKGLDLVDELAKLLPLQTAATVAKEVFNTAYLAGFGQGEVAHCGTWPPAEPPNYERRCLPGA